MTEPENQFKTATDGGAEELRNELGSLRMLVSAALVLLIVFCVCVDLYLSPQVSEEKARADQAAAVLNNFSFNAGEFWKRLVEYSKTQPDFAPVVAKWSAHVSMTTNGPPAKVK
jgi:hypothetical protein